MTKQDLEQTPAWQQLGPTAPLRYGRMELCNAHREQYPDNTDSDREAIVLAGSPLGLCIDFTDRRGLENTAAYYHAPQNSLIICRKSGQNFYPSKAEARNGCIVLE